MDKLNLSKQALNDRKMCSRSLYYLCKEVLGYKDVVAHVHGDLCDFATNPRFGRFRQATVPRSWFKTWTLTIAKSIWLTLPDEDGLYTSIYPYKGPNVRILIASNVIDNAAKMVNKIKADWQNNDRLKAAFPELVPDFNKTRWSDHCAQVKRPGNFTEGTYTAVGVGGSVISQHFDHIIEDDLVYAKKDDFTGQELMPSQEDIENAIGWHKLTFSLLADPQHGCIDNVGTRWAPHDMIRYIRENEKQYSTLEINATIQGTWPIPDNTYCTWPQRYDKDTLDNIRMAQGPKIFECFAAEAPILMADWTYKEIKDIVLGDEVVGFSDDGTMSDKSKLLKSKVNLLERLEKPVVKITLASGTVVLCTEDHPWYTGRKDKTHKPYLPARVGGKLLVIDCPSVPSAEDLMNYRYLGGLIDGEGACSHGSIAIGQSKAANPDVYAAIESVLKLLNIPYSIAKVNPNDTHILRNKVIRRGLGEAFVLGGGRQVKADIIRFSKLAKAHRILSTIWKHPSHPIKATDEVMSIEAVGIRTVYAIGTTSGNYVAYGYATKNTQYLNRPRSGEDVTFEVAYVNRHSSLTEYPHGLTRLTYVDLAGWKDTTKRLCRNVVLTGARDEKNHLWIYRVDAGRFNPTEVIELIKAHVKQFETRVFIEEIGYQTALRHFAKLDMEREGSFAYSIDPLPFDLSAGAKVMRIQSVQPVVKNGMLHVLGSMTSLMSELEDYPYSATKDILDCLGFLDKYAKRPKVSTPVILQDPFSLDSIELEILAKKGNSQYPFTNPLEADVEVMAGLFQ